MVKVREGSKYLLVRSLQVVKSDEMTMMVSRVIAMQAHWLLEETSVHVQCMVHVLLSQVLPAASIKVLVSKKRHCGEIGSSAMWSLLYEDHSHSHYSNTIGLSQPATTEWLVSAVLY